MARLRAEAEAAVEQLLALLDAIDGDPDLEPSLGAVEEHPFGGILGAPTTWRGDQRGWGLGGRHDLEDDPADDEPSLGATNPQPGQVLAVDHDGRQFPVRDVGFDQAGWACGSGTDLEDEHDGREDLGADDEPTGDDEDGGDTEPWLASIAAIDQRRWSGVRAGAPA